MGIAAKSFIEVRTRHEADITWWWTEDKLHDAGYHIEVNDSMRKKAQELERKYDVTDDTGYCCQWEGHMLYGAHKTAVEAAGLELARHLARFKGIRPLNL